MVAIELEVVEERERGVDVARLGDRRRAVQLHDRRAGGTGELAVQRREERPVGRVVHVQRRDLGLERVRADPLGAGEQRAAFPDLRPIPERPVLVAQEHDRAAFEPGLAASVVQQHQREQPAHLRFIRHQLGEGAAEPDRLAREIAAAPVALVEDQVDDCQHRGQTVRQQMRRRDTERDARRPDLRLGTDEPLGHRLVRDEEGAGNLLDGQPAERAQRQRDLRVERERRMAAREQQLQPLVGNRRLVHLVLRRLGDVEQAQLLGVDTVAAKAVDAPVTSRGDQPGPRALRLALARPALRGDRERLLGSFLGEVEVAEEADQRSQDATPLVAKGPLDAYFAQYASLGRISIAPPSRAAGTRAASSIAASRSSASRMK